MPLKQCQHSGSW